MDISMMQLILRIFTLLIVIVLLLTKDFRSKIFILIAYYIFIFCFLNICNFNILDLL